MSKYLKIVPLLVAALTALSVIRRELWFDEALTLLNFVLPLDLGKIYFSYIIPNNQIVYSMLLKVWDQLYCGGIELTAYWRILSLLCATAMLSIIMFLRNKIDEGKIFPAVLVLSAMSISAVFINYATALRGYAASWLFAAAALWGLYNIFHNRSRSGWFLYILSALLAVGTVPTNLLVLTAAAVYAVPWMEKAFWRDKRFYGVLAVIPASLIVFYAPIAGSFLNTFKLGEGFSSRSGAMSVTLGMYAASFGLLLFFALLNWKKQPWQHCLRYLIWLMPFGAILILHRAPFPRVFVTMLPVLAMLVIDGIAGLINGNWRKFHRIAFFLTIAASQCILIAGGAVVAHQCKLSNREDDFFHPWYMYPDYNISSTADELKKFPDDKVVFISFTADPAPLIFYAASNGLQRNFLSDIPYNSVQTLAKGSLLILASDEDPAAFGKRFNGNLRLLSKKRWQSIWELY